MNTLREHAQAILRAGIDAVAPEPLVANALAELRPPDRVHVLAVGKAAAAMARAAYDCWRGRIASALVVTPAPEREPWPDPAPVCITAQHPVPGPDSVRAARQTLALLEPLGTGDVVLCLLSGGASSLLTLPASGLSLEDLARTTQRLLDAGADIHQLNCVRKHLDDVKGGRLARVAAPARVLCLALSDVPGDDPAVIGSGPFAPDPSTFADARAVLSALRLESGIPAAVRAHLARAVGESVKPGDAALARVQTRIIGSNRHALEAAGRAAAELGYTVRVHDRTIVGEAVSAAGTLPLDTPPGTAWLAGGETTVQVRGPGRGGRNQELALAAAIRIAGQRNVVVACVGTDGVDGNSPAAGAVVDGSTLERLRAHGIDAARALAENDSHGALAAVGDAWITGPTGTNVMDLLLLLNGPGFTFYE